MNFKSEEWQSTANDITRAIPHALGIEKSVLSTLLQDPQEFIPLALEANLSEKYFYLPNHALLFGVIAERFSQGISVDLTSLIQHLIDTGKLNKAGGPSGVTDVYTYAPSSGYFKSHVEILKDKFSSREILRVSNEAISRVYDEPEEVKETLAVIEQQIMAIRDLDTGTKPQTVREAVAVIVSKFEKALKKDPASKGIATGFEEIDLITGGLRPGEMFVIGARPSVGKTALMANIAEHVCLEELRSTLIFSAEMTTEAIINRITFSRAKFDMGQLSRGYTPTKGDLLRIQRSALELAESKLHVDDKSGPAISYIAAKARRMKREHGVQVICIDYLGLIKSQTKQSQSSREREVAEISAGLKAMSKDLGVAVILLAQLNREVEKRATGKIVGRPRMSDLKDSGAIEADADIIGLLSREDYQVEDGSEPTGRSCLDIVKNRNGPTGQIPLTFVAELMRFKSGAPARESENQKAKSRFAD